MTGLQSPCRVQCTCRRYSSYVFEGKCYFLFVAAGSVLSFLCRLEAISLVSGACSQQPAGPSQATSTVKRLSGSYDTGSPRDTRKPSLRNGAPAGPAVGEGHLDCWLHRAWGNRKVPGNAPALQVSSEPLPGRSSQALHPAGVGRSHRRCLSRAFQERKTCLTWKAMPAGLVLEGAGGPRGPAGEEGLCRPPRAGCRAGLCLQLRGSPGSAGGTAGSPEGRLLATRQKACKPPTVRQKPVIVSGSFLPLNNFARGSRATANTNLLGRTPLMNMPKMLRVPSKTKPCGGGGGAGERELPASTPALYVV